MSTSRKSNDASGASGTLSFIGDGTIRLTGTLNCTGAIRVGERTHLVVKDAAMKSAILSRGVTIAEGSSASGTLTLTDGVLNTTFLRKGSGTATVSFNGGKLVATNATDTAATFFSGLSSISVGGNGFTFDVASYSIALPFNIAGPCNPARHYMLPATARLPEVARLIAREQYFAIHAARQSGKTTLLKGLVRDINATGDRIALYFTVESVQAYPDPHDGIFKIVECMRSDLLAHPLFGELVRDPASPVPKLLHGYVTRDEIPFPASVAIVGVMDIRDMKAKVRPHSDTLGSKSPFNVIAEDFKLRDFTKEEVASLYAQHTAATGQVFTPDALDAAMEWSGGQPWLVNALARESVEKIHDFRYDEPITAADIEEAKETIIRRRDTHVDSLMDRLRDPRVRRVMEPVMLGDPLVELSVNDEDYRYVQDLGLLKEVNGALVPSNRMYAEIIGRYLSRDEQMRMPQSVPDTPWATEDGLDMSGLMAAFQEFWRENSGADRRAYEYGEATPHLVLMAFLQRVTNGKGHIIREMALGSRRLDLCVEYRDKRYAVEVKTSNNFAGEKSYGQLADYLSTLGLDEGWMAIFDVEGTKPWEERLYVRDVPFKGKTLHVVGL